MVLIKLNRQINDLELLELQVIAEYQKTTDKYVNTKIIVDGEYAKLYIDFDEEGDITVL